MKPKFKTLKITLIFVLLSFVVYPQTFVNIKSDQINKVHPSVTKEKLYNLKFQTDASLAFGQSIKGLKIIPQIGLDLDLGKFGIRATGQYFKTSPDFDIDYYIGLISDHITVSGEKDHSNRLIGITPYLNFHLNEITIQPAIGLKYLSLKGADFKAEFDDQNLPPGATFDMTSNEQNRSLLLLNPNIRFVFGKSNKPLKVYIEGGYQFAIKNKEYSYTRKDLTNVIHPSGIIDPDLLGDAPTITNVENIISGIGYIGIGLELNIVGNTTKQRPGPNNVNVPNSETFNSASQNEKKSIDLPPRLISPINESIYSIGQSKKVTTFKWTPAYNQNMQVDSYIFRIFEIKEGENINDNNQPIFEKKISGHNYISNLILNDYPIKEQNSYAWYVQAIDHNGNLIPEVKGRSEVNNIRIQYNIDVEIDILNIDCCMNGHHQVYFKLKNNSKDATQITNIQSRINNNVSTNNLNQLSPPLPIIINGMEFREFTTSIPCNENINTLELLVDAILMNNNDVIQLATATDTLNCICYECDSINIDIPSTAIITNNTAILLETPVSVSPHLIKRIKAQLVYFEFTPEDDGCVNCNRNLYRGGSFLLGSVSDSDFGNYGYPNSGVISWNNELIWSSMDPNGAFLDGNFNISISYPQLSCCDADVKFCIRYIFEFNNCVVCEKVVCYSHLITNNK